MQNNIKEINETWEAVNFLDKLLIIDGNSILNRAYYGIRMLTAPDGTPTNAVYGFLNIMFKQLDELKPDGVCVAFDLKEKTFRHKMYELYKAQRKPAPEDFLVQIPVIKEVLEALNIPCLEKAGYEADDIIGTVSRICEESSTECFILTGDKDDLQLASDKVKINLVITKMGSTGYTIYDKDAVYEKYGVTPKEFIDVKALMGDSSDNIPGVLGIGEKTALSLIAKYKSIETIYENLDTIEVTNSVRTKLANGKESAFMSKTLATIERFVPEEYNISDFVCRKHNESLAALFTRLNFKSFLSRFKISRTEATQNGTAEEKAAIVCDKKCKKATAEMAASISGKVIYRYYKDENALAFISGDDYFCIENIDADSLKVFFEGKTKKIGYDIKSDIIALNKMGIGYNNLLFDVLIGAYIIDPVRKDYELSDIALQMANAVIDSSKEEESGQLTMDFGDKNDLEETAAGELFAINRLYIEENKKIKENNQEYLCEKIEMPLIEVLASMEITGVLIDREALTLFGKELKEKIDLYTKTIYDLAGREFNINSPKQLGEVLFVDLQLPHGKKTKTGYSTNADILEKLKDVHPIVQNILDYRKAAKLQSTYVDGLLSVIDPKTGRIHSSFNQTVTATGRISSTEPNLQNIPVRTPMGRTMRKMFIAGEGKTLVDADYSQIELRVLAHISGDENMKKAFLSGEDIHTKTASEVFKTSIDKVTPQMRMGAKAVNFGIVYGISEFSLASDLKIPYSEAKQYIEGYFETYPQIKKYLDDVVKTGAEKGYVETIFSRRRYMPELRASNKVTQAFGKRVAMNAPIQGSAADIIKIAMVNVYNALKENKLSSKLILQIHDELIVEATPSELEEVKAIVKREMENAVKLSVPLPADLNTGKSWYDTK